MMPPGQDAEIQVSWEDQQRINSFSRLNARNLELKADLKAKQATQTLMKDALTDMLMADDEDIFIQVGEGYVLQPKDDAEKILESRTTALEQEIDAISGEISKNSTSMMELKALLYANLGNSINLETEEK
eukprot:TRINITY_DN2910_c0_g1_i1.p1 TRINITY_DN2910_c0_g1~~TRINITY_DN2910_c0_g1_i1.p1  ORF type:complete len:130 (-),score=25.55 TRINITY_DN2910_c0_g1_i1:223-612(-)